MYILESINLFNFLFTNVNYHTIGLIFFMQIIIYSFFSFVSEVQYDLDMLLTCFVKFTRYLMLTN